MGGIGVGEKTWLTDMSCLLRMCEEILHSLRHESKEVETGEIRTEKDGFEIGR